MKQSQPTTGNRILESAAARPFAAMLLGVLLLFCSFAPVGFSLLAWIALIPWLALIETPKLEGNRPWMKIWLGGLLFWAAETYYVAIPHWLLWFAWIALFFYLSVYPLLFIWISRILVHDHRVPLVVAAPIVFTALEWVRAQVMGGFGVSMLANSQYRWERVIQVCDLAGAYGLTFLMVMVSCGILSLIMCRRDGFRWRTMGASALVLIFLIGYGYLQEWQVNESIDAADLTGTVHVMVIQGNIDMSFPETQAEIDSDRRRRLTEYADLHRASYRGGLPTAPSQTDVVIWPEGKYPIPDALPWSEGEDDESMRTAFRQFHEILFEPDEYRVPMIIGGTSIASDDVYNSALLLDADGEVVDRYFKMQRVPFGEYVPFSEWFPVLEQTPIGQGIKAGDEPASFVVDGWRFAPSICFESVVSHLVRDSVNQLAARGEEPDILVNLSDDGWFYGSAALDHHLACNVMRAVENRKPVVVAANTGLSALVDASGKIRKQGPRRDSKVLQLEVPVTRGSSLYRTVGDWPALTLASICVIAILTRRRGRGWVERNREQTND